MVLFENNELGEPLYQCDRCQTVGTEEAFVTDDSYQLLCFPCRYGSKENIFMIKEARFAEI